MKTTRWSATDAGSTAGGGGSSGPVGGDLGGTLPAPTVTGLDGKPFSAPGTEVNGDVPTYNSGTGMWDFDIPAGSGATVPWFIVTESPYNAPNDGSTDATSAINSAIAALNAAGYGVLYFPGGAGYVCSGALTTITAACLIMGDGMGGFDGATSPATLITCTSQTAVLFTVTNEAATFRGLTLKNTYSGTPSAGAGIEVTSSNIGQKVDFDSIAVKGFYVDIDVQVGAQWEMRNCYLTAAVLYCLKIRNTVNPDAGDWSITDSWFYAETHNPTSAIRIESAGGGKITNCKINSISSAKFVTGIDLSIASSSSSTSVLLITNTSIENVSGDAIKIATLTSGTYGYVTIVGCEVGLYSNSTGYAVNIAAAAAGGNTTPGGITGIVIADSVFLTDGTARAAVSLTNPDNVLLAGIVLVGFNAYFTQSGATNVRDDTGGVAAGVQITGTPVAGQVPTATSGTAATWQTPSTPAASTTDHEHIVNIQYNGDGSTTAFELPAAPFDQYSVMAYVAGVRQDITLSGTMYTTMTFGSAPSSGTNNIMVDIVAAVA